MLQREQRQKQAEYRARLLKMKQEGLSYSEILRIVNQERNPEDRVEYPAIVKAIGKARKDIQ